MWRPRPYHCSFRRAVTLLIVAGTSSQAVASEWVVINLHPPGAEASNLTATTGMAHQAGTATFSGVRQAGVWSGTPESWISLHPPGATYSTILDSNGIHQGGEVQFGGPSHAARWSLTPQSWCDMSPAGATLSVILSVGPDQQGGYAVIDGIQHPGIWTGTECPGSWIDLDPGANTAGGPAVWATTGVQQGGVRGMGYEGERGGYWTNGTPAPGGWTELHPARLPGVKRARNYRQPTGGRCVASSLT